MLLKNRKFLIWLAITMLWMIVIFMKSAQSYKSQDIRPFLVSIFPEEQIIKKIPHLEFYYDKELVTWTKPYDFLEFFIRKAAHITEYAALCLLWIKTWMNKPLSVRKSFLFSGGTCFLYACSDEYHQTFIQGRTGHFIDVLVDSAGIIGVIIGYGVVKTRINSSSKKNFS